MTGAFMNLPGTAQGAYCALCLILLCAGMLAALLTAVHRAPRLRLLACLIPSLADFMLLFLLMSAMAAAGEPHFPAARALWRAPVWALGLLLMGVAAWILLALWRQLIWRRSHVSRASVKEGLDQLPSGLCFYVRDGLPRLVNLRMDALCQQLLGAQLSNGEDFWRRLCEGDLLPGNRALQTGDAPIVQTPDGRVWSFGRSRIDAGGEGVMQIIASDISREHRMNRELEAQNRRLEEMNRRLRRYGENIRELTREKETLAAKMRIHDEFGQALLAAHRLTARPSEPEQRAEVLRLWRQNLTLMERLGEEKLPSQGFAALIASASAIGVRLTVDGSLPPEGTPCASLLESAARECLTNAARHAGGTELRLTLRRGSGRLRAVFTNDGDAPRAEIVEGGGLSSLRRSVESAGGSMHLESAPQFALTLELPLESLQAKSEEWT